VAESESSETVKSSIFELEEVYVLLCAQFDYVFIMLNGSFQYVFDQLQLSKPGQSPGLIPYRSVLFADATRFTHSTHSEPLPSVTGKRERESRRSSFSSELGSPVSATKGEKRVPTHGVWSHVSHRENWRSNLISGMFSH
jgi:hypothetical protein